MLEGRNQATEMRTHQLSSIETGELSHHLETSIAEHIIASIDCDDESRTELDSHADSPVVGRNSYLLFKTGKTVNVKGFTKTLGSIKSIPVVHAAVLYTDEVTGLEYILVINNALYFENMEHNLLPPFLVRLAGLEVDECPKFLAKNPTIKTHAICSEDPELIIPMSLNGTVSYIPTRPPDSKELDRLDHIPLTPNMQDWDPHTNIYSEQESCMLDYRGEIVEREVGRRATLISTVTSDDTEWADNTISSVMSDINDPIVKGSFGRKMCERTKDGTFCIHALESSRKQGIKYKDLAALFNISLETAKRTVQATTQHAVRSSEYPSLSRRYRTNDKMLRYDRLDTDIFMDTLLSTQDKKLAGKTMRGNTCAQVFVSDFGFVYFVPMERRDEVYSSVKKLFKHVGVPNAIVCDSAPEQISKRTRDLCIDSSCQIKNLEKDTPWANRAERYIGLMKDAIRADLKKSDCPMKFWDYCGERRYKIMNATARDIAGLDGMVPYTKATGQPYDISPLCEFDWYEWIYFHDNRGTRGFPYPNESLGRCLGPADHAGTAMSQWVLLESGKVLPIQTLRKLTPSEMNSETEKAKRQRFDEKIRSMYGSSVNAPDPNDIPFSDDEFEVDEFYADDDGETTEMPEADDIATDIDEYDKFINAEVLLPKDGEHMQAAKVVGRARDSMGNVKGSSHTNPMLDTRIYDVMFPDGSISQYAANIIAENVYAQVDDEGNMYTLLKEITDHKTNGHAVKADDGWNVSKNGRRTRKVTTKGWFLNVLWKDGSQQWVPLKDLKESNAIEVAEYAEANKLVSEPAFAWWVPFTLKKRDRIICGVDARVRKPKMKYGIELPSTVQEAYAIDEKNGNRVWRDAIIKEMNNVRIAFDIKDEEQQTPVGYIEIETMMVFDVKMDFTRKARLVARGDKTPEPSKSTYAGVVSRESVRIALTYAALNDLDITAADIRNAYLQAPCSEKYYTTCGPEFGSDAGKKAIITRALYGLHNAGSDYRNHLRDCMWHLKFESCYGDPDVWRRPAVRSDGQAIYEYVLLYTDDTLVVSENGGDVIRNEIGKYFDFKPESIGPPKIYLGGRVSKVGLPNGVQTWAFSASQYVQEAVKKVEDILKDKGMKLTTRANTPLSPSYRPELDQSPECTSSDASEYHSLIGILRWICELGRVEITAEVSMMASHLAMPREGHLQQVYHIFAYLKGHHNARMVFDPTYPDLDYSKFQKKDWSNIYGNTKEELPKDMPEPRGKGFIILAFVDADHAGEKLTRRSRTGFIVFLNMAPIYWFSKRQNGVECSSFGSEFIAMKQCTEYIRGLRYRLRMMGIPVEDPAFILGDNQSVLWNTSIPESTLKKKSNSIAYHFVREGVARDEWRTSYVNTDENPADILTKPVPAGEKRRKKVKMVLYDIYDYCEE